MMTQSGTLSARLDRLDDETRILVRLSAALAGGGEADVRKRLADAHGVVPQVWIEELLLQTYLFAGFPRALNGMREWRRFQPEPAAAPNAGEHRSAGESTCAAVYGDMYKRLRTNVARLHPLLDDWMIVEGYGKVLSRPGLDLPRRELCIVAACAASGQDRQLLSHLHGARNVGLSDDAIGAALVALEEVIAEQLHDRVVHMWNRVRNDIH